MSEEVAFFTLYGSLVRAGPGTPEEVDWAMSLLNPGPDGTICDAGCGPGADLPALLSHVPEGRVVGIEAHAPFVERMQAAFSDEPRITARVGDMADLGGSFDAIWCAGALYFLGVTEGLEAFKPSLAWGGGVAFSEPCWFTDNPSPAAEAFWGDYDGITTHKGLMDKVWAAGFDPIGDQPVSDAAWEAYYTPMERRIAELRDDAGPELSKVLDEAELEIARWRAAREETGYLLVVAVPR